MQTLGVTFEGFSTRIDIWEKQKFRAMKVELAHDIPTQGNSFAKPGYSRHLIHYAEENDGIRASYGRNKSRVLFAIVSHGKVLVVVVVIVVSVGSREYCSFLSPSSWRIMTDTAPYSPSPHSLQHRANLAQLIRPLKRVRPRVPFWELAAHRIPTLWSLYRGLLRSAPGDNIRCVQSSSSVSITHYIYCLRKMANENVL